MGDRLIHETTSLCRECHRGIPARVVARDGRAWMQKRCPEHGQSEIQLSNRADWYERTLAYKPLSSPPPKLAREVEHGCPFDCGPCTSHTQRIRMPVVTITSACDLDCPICYVHNKNEGAFFMAPDELARVLAHLVEHTEGEVDLINLTGGEPTLHPQLPRLIEMCHEAGIHRVSLCSHGLGLPKRGPLLERLAELDARVALSFDTFDPDTDRRMNGVRSVDRKLHCLEILDQHGIDTTLIPVMTRGYNDHEIGRIIRLGLELECVRHLEVHTITFTGQSGTSFDRGGRIGMLEVLEQIEQTTDGLLGPNDFVPSPSAHPLCYQIAYLLTDADGGPAVPFTRFLEPKVLYDCLADHLYLEPSPRLEHALQDAIDALWVADDQPHTLELLNALLRRLFPAGEPISAREALRRSERSAKAIYVHSHMDEDNFDTDRAAQCCDSNCYADGTTIPVCNYNVLYRDKEPRFMAQPRDWGDRAGGRRFLPVL